MFPNASLAKVSHQAKPGSRRGKVDAATWWEEKESHTAEGVCINVWEEWSQQSLETIYGAY